MRITVRGAELDVDDAGEGEPAFVWGHGLTSSRSQEDETALFDWSTLKGPRLVRYDARGHGRSAATTDEASYRWDELARDLLGLADALGLHRFVAGGASMGCATAVHAAVQAPERVRALVLAIPPTAWESRPAQAELYRAAAHVAETRGVHALVESLRALPPPPVLAEGGPELREAGLRATAAMDGDALPVILRGAARSDLPPADVVASITQPVLVLAWAGDPAHPVSTATRLGEVLADVEVHVSDHLDQVRSWPAIVGRFLDRVGTAGGD